MMSGLPILLKKTNILLIGAGVVAAQKHKVLLDAGFNPIIKAAAVCNGYFDDKNVEHIYLDDDSIHIVDSFDVVIDASGDSRLSSLLFNRKRHYLLNVVDHPTYCDFYFGATVHYGNMSVMVSSDGASPILAQKVRDKISSILPKNLAHIVTSLQNERLEKGAPDKQRCVEIAQQSMQALGKVFIIGCGPHSKKSLTLQAFEALSSLDVALIDNLVGEEIWDILKQHGCEIVSVAKQKGKQQFKQADINRMMLEFVRDGKTVGRIKGGDPAIFGRVFEEASYLSKHGVDVEIIGGVTSALSGALSSGIAPTIRGVSTGVLIVSAHLRESVFNIDWIDSLKNHSYTVIVLMAYSFVGRIVEAACERNIDLSLPAAIVSKIDSPSQLCVVGTLGKLEEMIKKCSQPAILIIGHAVHASCGVPFVGERIYWD